MLGFERIRSVLNGDAYYNTLLNLKGDIDTKWSSRLSRIRTAWNFYEGYHWEDIPCTDDVELSVNYCRAFVNKFVSFELGKAWSFTTHSNMSDKIITDDGRTLFEFLEDVWEDNDQYGLSIEMGQTKSVTGEAWIRVNYDKAEDLDDPFGEYPDGRISVSVIPTNIVFPEFNPHNTKQLDKLTIMYVYKKQVKVGVGFKTQEQETLFRQVWTKDTVETFDGDVKRTDKNKYGVIPFVQIKNLSIAGKVEGVGDLDDIIPLNVEYNLKQSNVSEIISYHSAPITVVYGAKISNIEKGANKVWGGLPKDAKVENLEQKGDGGTAKDYITNLKLAMCEIGGVPETVLGGAQAISNTSGVALQYINLPLIEKTRIKKMNTETGLERVNKMIILVALCEGIVKKPEGITNRDFFHTEVELADTLPKDTLIELQQIQMEMSMGIEDRYGAMKRMGRENIEEYIKRVDKDREEHPDIYSSASKNKSENGNPSLNSGIMNGETAAEHMRIALNGKNGND